VNEHRCLTPAEITAGLATLPGWTVAEEKLRREFTFPDFTRAFGFMASVALIAESMDHHPEWSNVYNRVTIALVTHSLGGISTLDLDFARRTSALMEQDVRKGI
jgi:4a-hydroxytetrahydrobiopterin dehydratase